jgi:hypothetical protein
MLTGLKRASLSRGGVGVSDTTGHLGPQAAVGPRGIIETEVIPIDYIDIAFDGPPSPEGARFVESRLLQPCARGR